MPRTSKQAESKALEKVTLKELEAEILKRRAAELKAPMPLAEPDFCELIKLVINGIHETVENKREDEDFCHHVYEEALKAIYGEGIFEWLNSVTTEG